MSAVQQLALAELAAAVRRLALATLLQNRLAEDSPAAAAGGVYGWCFRVAAAVPAAAAVRAVLLPVHSLPPCSSPMNEEQGHQHGSVVGGGSGCVWGGGVWWWWLCSSPPPSPPHTHTPTHPHTITHHHYHCQQQQGMEHRSDMQQPFWPL